MKHAHKLDYNGTLITISNKPQIATFERSRISPRWEEAVKEAPKGESIARSTNEENALYILKGDDVKVCPLGTARTRTGYVGRLYKLV